VAVVGVVGVVMGQAERCGGASNWVRCVRRVDDAVVWCCGASGRKSRVLCPERSTSESQALRPARLLRRGAEVSLAVAKAPLQKVSRRTNASGLVVDARHLGGPLPRVSKSRGVSHSLAESSASDVTSIAQRLGLGSRTVRETLRRLRLGGTGDPPRQQARMTTPSPT
jgi:hypothetical protein